MDVGATLGSRRHRPSVAHSEILLTYGRSTGSPLQGSLRKTHRGSRRHLPAAQRPFLCCSKTTFLQDLPPYKFARVCAFWAMDFGRANALSPFAVRRFGIGDKVFCANHVARVGGILWTILLEREYFFVQQNVRIPMRSAVVLALARAGRDKLCRFCVRKEVCSGICHRLMSELGYGGTLLVEMVMDRVRDIGAGLATVWSREQNVRFQC